MVQDIAISFLYSLIIFGTSLFCYKILIPIFRKRIIDLPNSRSSHLSPTPTSGGIIFSIFGSLISYLMGNFIILCAFPLSLVGFIDDIKNLNPLLKYFFQVFTVSFILIFLNDSILISSDKNIYSSALFPILIIAFSGIINFINFMDGIDGLVSGCFLIILGVYCFTVNSIFWPLLPPLAAFFIFNWSPAKIFMGDSGSLFLGSVFIILVLKAPTFQDAFNLIILASPLFLDAVICIFRRLLLKQNIFKPHKSHLYQRMVGKGFSHSIVSSIYIISTIFLAVIVMYYNLLIKIICLFVLLIFGMILDKYFAIPFLKSINPRI